MPSLKERPPNHEGGPPSFSQDARSDLQEPVSSDHDIEHGGPGQTRDKPLRVRYQPRDRGALIETVRLHPENMRQADALELIIVAAIVASRVDPLRWISYSRRHDWWTNARRYMPRSCTHATVVRGVDLLAAQGLLEHDRKRPGNLGWQSRFRATNALINLIEKALPSLVWVPAETILLKDEAKRLIGYPDTPDTLDLRRRLIPIVNQRGSGTRIQRRIGTHTSG